MILELNGTKVTIVDKTLGYQGDNLVDTIQVTVDKDSTWNYKLDMYKGKSKCFDSVLMTREGNICTVQLTNEILSYGGRYVFQLRGYTDTQTYHSDIFESWVNASIEYQDDCKQGDCECDCKLPTEFYQVEDNVTEINNHPPYPGDNNKWMIWDVNKHQYVESDIDVISGGEEYQTKANLTTSITAESTDQQYPSAKATYDAIQAAKTNIIDETLTEAGKAADAAAVGERLSALSEEIAEAKNVAQDYYLLKSPSGTVYKVTVTNSGTLQVVGEASGGETPDDILTGRLLVWNDEFNEPEINASNWFFRRDSSEFVDTVVVADGVLDMPISYNANTGQWQRFQMLSSGLMDLKYGRIEARMKWDVGVHSAFWLVGQTSQRYNGVAEGVLWPRAGEIDVFEDNGDGAIYTTLHFGEKEGEDVAHDSISVCRKSDIDVTQWHTYGVEWTENMMIFYCDNVEMGRVDTSSIVYEDGTKPFQMPFYLIVSNRYGSGVTEGQTYHCYTDWVRYYAPEYVTTEIPIESISFSESTVELNPKRVRELELSITPEYVTDYTMRWYSSDKNVAKFSAGNRIETLTNGNTELSVVMKDGLTAKCNLIVSDSILNEVAVITLDAGESNTYYVGEVTTIEATVTPKWATYLDCDWETSDANIATVVDGVVTFVGGGEVTITAKAKDNSGVSCSITFTVIEKIVDNISLDGVVTKYTRKGWDSNGWAADDNLSDLLQISGYVQGVGYYYTNIISNEQSYTPVNLDTSGDFSIAERVLLKKGRKSGSGAIWQIFASESVPSGASISSSCVHFALENSGKGTARYYNPDGSIAINKYGAFDIYANKIADGYLTEDVVLNLVFTHNSSGGYAVYANGDLLVSGTDTGQAIKLDNPILCLGAYPGKTRQGGSNADFIYQALIAYNKCLTADDVSAVNTALNEMYS